MKKTTLALLTTTLMGGLLAGTATAQAQEKPAQTPAVKTNAPAARPTPVRRDITDFYAQQLKLNDEQKQKVKPIMDDEQKSLADLRQQIRDKKITQDEYRKKSLETREASNAKIKPILTDEQWERFSKLRGGGMRPVGPATTPPPAAPAK